jgi:hypothetical protein
MKRTLIALLLVGACTPVRAGVYNLDYSVEMPFFYRPQAKEFAPHIFELRGLAAPLPAGAKASEGSLRARYLAQVEAMEKHRKADTLFVLERVNLSTAYLRLGKASDALKVLREADQDHFLVQANLAGVYQSTNELRMAIRHQRRALAMWPAVCAWWPTAQLDYYRECEQYNLKLLESRLQEEARASLAPGRVGLDPLFPGVRFVGADGKTYQAGELSWSMADKLPKNAPEVVLQLVNWQPLDLRLCWLLAELANAKGEVEQAYLLFNDLVFNRGLDWVDLRAHSRVVRNGASVLKNMKEAGKWKCYSGMMIVPALASPREGGAASQMGVLAPVVLAPELDKPKAPPQLGPADLPSGAGPQPQWPFNWRHILFSFVFGFLVAALVGLQVQQWRRPRRTAPDFPEPEQTTGPAGDEAAGPSMGGATHALDPGNAGKAAGWQAHPDRTEGIRGVP